MILQKKSEKADWIAKEIIGKELLSLDPIIAGGAALFIYRSIMYFDTKYKWSNFCRSVKSLGSRDNIIGVSSPFTGGFSDIDIWFLLSNDIFSKSNDYNFLISATPIADSESFKLYNDIKLNYLNSSTWCNTWEAISDNLMSKRREVGNTIKCPIQFIKKGFDSVDSLIESFDFINCSVAWHNGILYYDSRIDESFKSFELRSKDISIYYNNSIINKIFHCNRAFKYSKRFCLDFDSSISKYVLQTYIESKEVSDIIKSGDTTLFENISFPTGMPYGVCSLDNGINIDSVRVMLREFYKNFSSFKTMKTFNNDWPIYLVHIGDEISMIRDELEARIMAAPRELWSNA